MYQKVSRYASLATLEASKGIEAQIFGDSQCIERYRGTHLWRLNRYHTDVSSLQFSAFVSSRCLALSFLICMSRRCNAFALGWFLPYFYTFFQVAVCYLFAVSVSEVTLCACLHSRCKRTIVRASAACCAYFSYRPGVPVRACLRSCALTCVYDDISLFAGVSVSSASNCASHAIISSSSVCSALTTCTLMRVREDCQQRDHLFLFCPSGRCDMRLETCTNGCAYRADDSAET